LSLNWSIEGIMDGQLGKKPSILEVSQVDSEEGKKRG